jgi:hypothetical protein
MTLEALEPRCMLAVTGDLFYLAASSGTQLYVTAPTASAPQVSLSSTRQFMDLAADTSGTLYGVSNRTDGTTNADLYTIDPSSGAATWIQSIGGYKDINALEITDSGTIFAAHSSGALLQLTGSSYVQVGSLANGCKGDLAYQASTGRLYFIDNSNRLEYYDIALGTAHIVGGTGFGAIYAMDFSKAGTLYAVNSGTSTQLLSINLSTGASTVVQTYTGLGEVWGLAADEVSIDVTPSVTSGVTTTESGGTDTFTLALASQPLANVTVALSSDDTGEGTVSPQSVIFTTTDWSTPQTVTVTGQPDSQSDGDVTYHVVTGAAVSSDPRYSGLAVSDIAVTNSDIDPPVVTFTVANQSLAESSGAITVNVRLVGGATTNTVTVPFSTSGTATNGVDYSVSASPLTFYPGETSATITLDVVDDGTDEPNETVILTLGMPTGAGLGAVTTYTATISDNDVVPTVQFTTSSQPGAESAGTVLLTAQLSSLAGQDVTIPFTTAGTATRDTDYYISASPLVIPAGQTTATISLNLYNDTLHEAAETVVVTMSTPTGATLGGLPSQTVTIIDDDAAPSVQFTLASQSHVESYGSVTATIELSAVSGLPVTVPFTVAGTATPGSDYSITPSPLTIPAGETTATININVLDDQSYEFSESVGLTLNTPSNATLGAAKTHTTLIENDDALPTVDFAIADQLAGENTGTMTVIVTLSAPSALDVSVPFGASGTASGAGVDYMINSSPLLIPAGQSTGTITISMVDDGLYEPNETVVLTLSQPGNGYLGAQTLHTATLADNDLPPVVQFTRESQSSWESVGTFVITAQLSTVSGLPVTLPFTVSGTAGGSHDDYAITDSPLTIPAGQTTATITIEVNNDQRYEYDETIAVTLDTPVNATLGTTTTHTATILNDDAKPTVQFVYETQSGAEGTTITVTAQLSLLSGVPVSVPFTVSGTATAGTDYTLTQEPFAIAPGESEATIILRALDDSLHENDETVIVSLDEPSGATLGVRSNQTVTIVDNDLPPVVQFATATKSVVESEGTVSISVVLSAVSGLPVTLPFTVSGTATGAGTDYMISTSPITIPAGQSTATIDVRLARDQIDEADETLVVTLGTPTEATLGATRDSTLTIINAPTAQITTANQSGPESGTMTVTVELSSPSVFPVTLPFTLSGTAASGVDYTTSPAAEIVIPAGETSGTVTINVTDDLLYERNETIVLALGTPTNAFLGSASTHTATITNDDPPPVVQLSATSQTVCESDGQVTIGVQLSTVSGAPVELPFTLSGNAVGGGTDYTAIASPLVIPAGQTTGWITLDLNPDLLDESDENVVLTLGTPTDATLGAQTVHTLTIINAPVVQFTTSTQTIGETGLLTITVQLSAASTLPITLPFTVTGTAESGSDYVIPTSPLTISPGQLSASITVTVLEDSRYENDETIVVTLDKPTNAVRGATATHTATIRNDDPMPSVAIYATSESLWEDAGQVMVLVQLSAVSGLPVVVPFTVTGTATNGTDYTIDASPLTIPAGSLTGWITLNVTEDLLYERSETISVTLGTPTGATLGTSQAYTLTVIDNDNQPTVEFTTASQSAAEGDGTLTITVQLSAASGLPITVPFTVSGTAGGADYTITGSPLTIPAGQTSATITVQLVNDGLLEPNETIVVTLGTPTDAALGIVTLHTVTIVGDGAHPNTIGLFDPSSSFFHLRCSNTGGESDYTFGYGNPGGGWIVLEGDWNGDGVTGVGLYDPAGSTFYLTNAYRTGFAEYTFGYGEPHGGWIPLVGDWNGDGSMGVGLYDPKSSTFYLTDTLESGFAQYTFGYGEPNAGWTPLVGDWDGNGSTGVGLYNPHSSGFYLTNNLRGGFAEHTFGYGQPDAGWQPMVGDWDGNGSAGVGLYSGDSSTFYLTNAFVSGFAQYTFGYGEPKQGWQPIVGDWNGNGAAGVGLYAPSSSIFYLTDTLSSGYAEYTAGFGQPGAGWKPIVGYWGDAPQMSALVAEPPAGLIAPSSVKAVDQIDLGALATQTLSHTDDADLDTAIPAGVNEIDWLMAHGI